MHETWCCFLSVAVTKSLSINQIHLNFQDSCWVLKRKVEVIKHTGKKSKEVTMENET